MHVTSAMNLPGLKGPLSLSYISLTVLSGGAHMLPCMGFTSPDVWLQSPSSYWCSHYCTVWNWFGNIGIRWNIGFMKSMRVKGKNLYSSIKPSCLLDLWFLLYLLWSWFWLWSILDHLQVICCSILEAWEDRCPQPAGHWQQHDRAQGHGAATRWISENKKIQVTNTLTRMDLEKLAISGNVSYSFHLQQAFIAISAKFG